MLLILKAHAGTDYILKDGRRLSLQGRGIINDVDDALFEAAKKEYPETFKQLFDDGFLVIAKANTKEAADEAQAEFKEAAIKKERAKANPDLTTGA